MRCRGGRAVSSTALHDLCCRVSRGEKDFADGSEAARFAGISADVEQRDDFAVLAIKQLAERLGVNPGGVRNWAGRGAAHWVSDETLADRCLDLERAVSARLARLRGWG